MVGRTPATPFQVARAHQPGSRHSLALARGKRRARAGNEVENRNIGIPLRRTFGRFASPAGDHCPIADQQQFARAEEGMAMYKIIEWLRPCRPVNAAGVSVGLMS